MLTIRVPGKEYFNDTTSEFITVPERVLHLEHSLVSVSKWESRWHKPFLSDESMTPEQSLDYIRCMSLDDDVPALVYRGITQAIMRQVESYIQDPMTGTVLPDSPGTNDSMAVTAERIYSRMIAYKIPFTCENWHLNRLLMLMRVCAAEQTPPKPMSKQEIFAENQRLNAKRKKELGSNG